MTDVTEMPSDGLEFTGERFTPECVREIWYEHMHRYVLAGELVSGLTVLDAACGEGYGSSYLASRASHVTGVDISQDSISHARSRYAAENLDFDVADCRDLPFGDGQFDCVISFETLEHLVEQEALLHEFRRVLAPGGFLMISSPDKAVYSEKLKNENPFHLRELYRGEFEKLLAREFPAVELLGHKLAFHSMIWRLNGDAQRPHKTPPAPVSAVFHQDQGKKVARVESPSTQAVYLIALCAADRSFLPTLTEQAWLFDDAAESVYSHYQHEIRKNMSAGAILNSLQDEIEKLKQGVRPWWRRLFKNT